MTTDDEIMLKDAQDILDECIHLIYLSIGIEFQKAAIQKLDELHNRIEDRRKNRVAAQSEQEANLAWITACYVRGMRNFLSLWVHIKEDKMESAWDALVTAQMQLETGLRLWYKKSFDQLNRRLYGLEQLLFPPCMFVSSSLVVGGFDCSICGAEYGECNHLAMNLYMGEMCVKVARDVSHLDHVAIVPDPEDKRLRFPALIDGKDLCSLTYRPRINPEQVDELTNSNSAPSHEAEPGAASALTT